MKITVKVKPNSKQEKVEKINEKDFILRVKTPPIENKANEAVRELLSEYFHLPKSRITIVKGHKNKNKIIDLQD